MTPPNTRNQENIQHLIEILGLLAVFAKVVQCDSFKLAAAALGKGPPAVSRDIAALEKRLKVTLVKRPTRNGVQLTDIGELVFLQSARLLEATQAIQELLEYDAAAPSGILRISTTDALARWVIQPHVASFLLRYPQISIDINIVGIGADLAASNADLLALPEGQQPRHMVATKLVEVRYLLCATPQYLNQHGKPRQPSDLTRYECLHFSEGTNEHRWIFLRGDEEVDIKPQCRYVANNSQLRLHAILSHVGIGCLPVFAAQRALDAGLVEQVLPDWTLQTPYSGQTYLSYPQPKLSPPKVRLFVDHLREALAMAEDAKLAGGKPANHPGY